MKNPVNANWIGVSLESGVNCRAFLRFVVVAAPSGASANRPATKSACGLMVCRSESLHKSNPAVYRRPPRIRQLLQTQPLIPRRNCAVVLAFAIQPPLKIRRLGLIEAPVNYGCQNPPKDGEFKVVDARAAREF
jgi:hypothetical protein